MCQILGSGGTMSKSWSQTSRILNAERDTIIYFHCNVVREIEISTSICGTTVVQRKVFLEKMKCALQVTG